jgi:hypothetical protein
MWRPASNRDRLQGALVARESGAIAVCLWLFITLSNRDRAGVPVPGCGLFGSEAASSEDDAEVESGDNSGAGSG